MNGHQAPRAGRASVLALLAAAILTSGGPARSDEPVPHPVLREFQPTGKFVLVSQPASAGSSISFSQRAAAFLVEGSALGTPFLVRTGVGSVESVPLDALILHPDGRRDLQAAVKPTPLGRTSVRGGEIHFRLPGLDGRLAPPPPVLGWLKSTSIATRYPEYDRDARAYQPQAEAVHALRAVPGKVQVFLYFGSWCPTCQMLLGRVMRVEREVAAGRPEVTFDYYGVPPGPQMHGDPEVRQRGIQRLPTGIVYWNDRYVGPIVGTAWNRPEQALLSLLRSAGER